jgi:methyltransferase
MALSVAIYLGLLGCVGLLRLLELRISRRNQARMIARGARLVPDSSFRWMVVLHTGILVSSAVEVVALHRRFVWGLAAPMAALFLAANVGRWWVIRTLRDAWTVRVMTLLPQAVAIAGPFRFLRHPNYACVFAEMLALPLIHSAWITAVAGSLAHILILRVRLRVEDAVLFAEPAYRAVMASKARFTPRLP